VATYTARELATAFRRVRDNTIRAAEEIPEDQYGFRATPDTKPVGVMLAHIAAASRLQMHIQGRRVASLAEVDLETLLRDLAAAESQPRSKAEVLQFLREEGERFASFLEGLSDDMLDEHVATPGDELPSRSRLEMLMGVKEHEMHHRAQVNLIQRMLGGVPHLTRRRERGRTTGR